MGHAKKIEEGSFPIRFIGQIGNDIYLYTNKSIGSAKCFIEKYDIVSKTLKEVNAENTGDPFIINDRIGIFTQEVTEEKITISYHFFNPSDKNSTEKKVLFECLPNLVKTEYQRKKVPNRFNFHFPEEKQNFVLFRNDIENKKIEYYIISNDLKVKKEEFNYESSEALEIDQVYFMNGKLFFICKQLRPKNEWKENSPGSNDYYYCLLAPKGNNQPITPRWLKLQNDHYIVRRKLTLDQNNNIIFWGTYQNKTTCCSRVVGLFSQLLDINSEKILNQIETDFSKEFSLTFINEKEYEKKMGIEPFTPRTIFNKNGENPILIFEKYWQVQKDNAWHFNAHEIVTICLNNKGEIEWSSIIPKQQQGSMWTNGMYLSFVPLFYQNKLFYIFNDNSKNLDKKVQKDVQEFEVLKGSHTVLATTDCTNGTWEKKVIYGNEGNDFYITPPFIIKLNDQEAIIHGQYRETVVLGKLKVN